MNTWCSLHILIILAMPMISYALENVKFHTMLQGKTLNVIPGISFNDCWSNCEQRPECGSINYEQRPHICHLNYADQSGEMALRAGVLFRKKSAQSTRVACEEDTCLEGKVCDIISKTCKVAECKPLQIRDGVDVSGNMVSVGSKKMIRCREGFIPKEGQVSSMIAICEEHGWKNEQLECVPLTCQGLADIGHTETHTYISFNKGSQQLVKIFCEFISEEKRGYTFIFPDSLTSTVQINEYLNRNDHVMLRFIRAGIQHKSKIKFLSNYRDTYNISFFNSENPDFSGPSDNVAKPYLFFGFIPISIGYHENLTKGYTCNEQDYDFVNCDNNTNNYFAIYQSKNAQQRCYEEDQKNIRDGWKICAVESSRHIPKDVFFNSYEIGMGGCGCIQRNCEDDIHHFALGLPFEY